MDRVRFNKPSSRTRNYHFNYLYPYRAQAKVLNPRAGTAIERYNESAKNIQDFILKKALQEHRRVHPIGSRWSLSEAPYGRDYTLDNLSLNLILPITSNDLHVNNTVRADSLCFVQSGKKIKSISGYLRALGKSLKASGASNGQTIGGAISTGVHGSAIDAGSIQDGVLGLNIIISDTQNIYIERASQPVLSDAYARQIHAAVIRDDDLFNAALVSLGAFGFIHGVLMEVEDLYLLERHIIRLPRNEALDLAKNQNFTTTRIPLPHPGTRPYHYKLYMNPFKRLDPFVIEIIYKRPFGPYTSPIKTIRTTYYKDVPSLISTIVSAMNRSVPTFVDVLSKVIFPRPTDQPATGTLAEIFYNTDAKGAVYGMAIATPAHECERVLNAMNTLMVSPQNVPGILSMRFVSKTKATMGFTRFDKTAVVEVDGVKWNQLDSFLGRMTGVLSGTSNLDFALHWGKNASWNPALIDRIYGTSKASWMAQRDRIITPAMRRVFASKFLEDIGLD